MGHSIFRTSTAQGRITVKSSLPEKAVPSLQTTNQANAKYLLPFPGVNVELRMLHIHNTLQLDSSVTCAIHLIDSVMDVLSNCFVFVTMLRK